MLWRKEELINYEALIVQLGENPREKVYSVINREYIFSSCPTNSPQSQALMTFTWLSERFPALYQPILRLKISRGNLYYFFLSWPFLSGDSLDANYELNSCPCSCEVLVEQVLSDTERPCWLRSSLQQAVTQARQENRACRSNPFHSMLSLPAAHCTFFLWMPDDSLIYYSLFKKSSWQSICFKPHYILFVCCSLVTILKKKKLNKITN